MENIDFEGHRGGGFFMYSTLLWRLVSQISWPKAFSYGDFTLHLAPNSLILAHTHTQSTCVSQRNEHNSIDFGYDH